MGKGEEGMPEFGKPKTEFGFALVAASRNGVWDHVQVFLDGLCVDGGADMFSPFCNARSASAFGWIKAQLVGHRVNDG
jgi:hypothetical protein